MKVHKNMWWHWGGGMQINHVLLHTKRLEISRNSSSQSVTALFSSLEVTHFVVREGSCLSLEQLVIIFKLLRHLHGQLSGFHQLRFFNCMQWGKDAICAMWEFARLFTVLILWLRLAAAHLNVNSHHQMLWHCSKSVTWRGCRLSRYVDIWILVYFLKLSFRPFNLHKHWYTMYSVYPVCIFI